MSETAKKDYLSLPLRVFLDDLAAIAHIPGGGSTAALTGSLGASLGHMVAGYALKRARKQGGDINAIQEMLDRLDRARNLLAGLIAEDIAAYDLWVQSSKIDPNAPDATATKHAALDAAVSVPSEILAVTAACLDDLAALCPDCSKYLWTDLLGAAQICLAAGEAAAWTVYSNLASADLAEDDRKRIADEIEQLRDKTAKACRQVEQFVREKLLGAQ